jgi:mRNA-degrading endonuclease RelE of RelBE toxin-antitoxin system
MIPGVTVLASFLKSSQELPREMSAPVLRALRNFVNNPLHPGLHLERLSGKASNFWSIRVNDAYRIILQRPESAITIAVYVAKHDEAIRFAERGASAEPILALTEEPQIVHVSSLPLPKSAKPHVAKEKDKAVRIDLQDLESLIKTRKYLPLARALLLERGPSAAFTFTQIEYTIGDSLPPAARRWRAWWANDRQRHVQASSWLGVGWRVTALDMERETVTFVKA